jgi:Spy/CpxP family protein refolding chaperone
MKLNWSYILTVAFSSTLTLSAALAETSAAPSTKNPAERFVDCFKNSYKPTAEQTLLLDEISKTPSLKEKVNAINSQRKLFVKSLEGKNPDSEVLSDFKQMKKLENELEISFFEEILKIRKTMTPEQKKIYSACKSKGENL